MAIYTSRYSNKELRNEGYYPVGISLGQPKFSLGYGVREHCYSLAPKGYMLRMDYEQYRKAYFGKLDAIGKEVIVNRVAELDKKAMAEGKDLVFLCFEDVRVEGEWCHRTLFAEWWKDVTGEVIRELNDPTPPKTKRTTNSTTNNNGCSQMSLF